ncbi:MAG: branched-chain amino acid ABC transporter permease [Desulfovibrio sp.]|jgi:branched-chain amino acid transport system permease protein|nr:branched-chain amino acid ABC transporter permease [Desulfovibrio sp.]
MDANGQARAARHAPGGSGQGRDLFASLRSGPFGGPTPAVAVLLVLMPFALPSSTMATEILIFATATLACNLLLGYGGLLSFGQAIFFGSGAYLSSLTMMRLGAGLLPALLVAVVAGAVSAALVGALSVRRTGIYFVMMTLAFNQTAYFIAYTLSDWTGGDNGLLDVPRPPLALFGVTLADLSSATAYYVFTAVIFLLIFIAVRRVIASPFGSTLIAVRENEARALALGYDTRNFKIAAFAVSGAMTSLSGALYAMLLNFAPLENIQLSMSENIVIMTVIGGTGSLLGSLLGAGAWVIVSDMLAEIWPRWLILTGGALILIVLFLRGGLWGGVESLMRRFGGGVPYAADGASDAAGPPAQPVE